MMKFELPTYSNQKSYYGKALVLCCGSEGKRLLRSYDTIVCGIIDGEFVRYWNDYSVTTMKHINSFRKMHCLEPLGKKEWEALPIA